MKANRIDLFSSLEKTAWEEFHEKRTSEIKTQFPDASSNEIEHRVWIEFIAMKYSLSLPSPFSDKPSIMDSFYTNEFGPDSRPYLRCFSHSSVAKIPEEALVSQNININEIKSPILSKKNKPLSLYNFFFKRKLEEYRNKHPMMKIQEISRLIGQEWHLISRPKIEDEYFIEFGSRPP